MFSFRLNPAFLESYVDRQPDFGYRDVAGNSVGEIVFLRTYSRLKENGSKERWWEVCRRVTEGTYSIQKDHAKLNRLPWNDHKAQRSAQEFYERLFAFKFSPPGRGLWMMGTPLVNRDKAAASLQNCWRSDTEIVTADGTRKIGDLAGTVQRVLTSSGKWVDAPILSFGVQSLMKVTVTRQNVDKILYCTPEHGWFASRNGKGYARVETKNLVKNMRLQEVFGSGVKNVTPSPFGISRGFAFGDGRQSQGERNGNSVTLFGEKKVVAKYFDLCRMRWNIASTGGPEFGGLPNYFKDLPSLHETKEYLYGWLAGLFAADGTVSKTGQVVFSNARMERIQFVRDLCYVLGIGTYGGRRRDHVSNLTGKDALCFSITFMRDTLTEEFFLIDKHRARWLANPSEGRSHWLISNVEKTDLAEEVFCATVDGVGNFVIADNILSANCAFQSTGDMTKQNPSAPFTFLMEASMLGIGVGFDTKGALKDFKIYEPSWGHLLGESETFVIPDSREGWVASVRMLLDSYLTKGKRRLVFDYSQIRPEGELIKTFGGVAAGPAPLQRLHRCLDNVFTGRDGHLLTTTDVADIGNLIGVCVVSGNVRRSAEILLGDINDKEFLNLKNVDVNAARMRYSSDPDEAGWGWMSNNSVVADVDTDLTPVVEGIARNGEPGVVWLDVARAYGRLIDPPNNKDWRVAGVNPCVVAGTTLLTEKGLITFGDAYKTGQRNMLLVDSRVTYVPSGDGLERSENWKVNYVPGMRGVSQEASEVFLTQRDAEVVKVTTSSGYEVTLTPDHLIASTAGMVAAGSLTPGTEILLTAGSLSGTPIQGRDPSTVEEIEAALMGLIAGDGYFSSGNLTEIAHVCFWGADRAVVDRVKSWIDRLFAEYGDFTPCPSNRGWSAYHMSVMDARGEVRLTSSFLAAHLKAKYDFSRDTKLVVPAAVMESARTTVGAYYLAALFFCDGTVNKYAKVGSSSIRLSQVDRNLLLSVQRMLLANGIASSVYKRSIGGCRMLPNGKGGAKSYPVKPLHEVVIMTHTYEFTKFIGFLGSAKDALALSLFTKPSRKRSRFTTRVERVETAGREDVFCLQEPIRRILAADGITMRRCAEQPLESGETCTLAENYLERHDNIEDFKRTLKFSFLYAKSVTLMSTHWPETNAIMQRNRRIGCSVSGLANFVDAHGVNTLRKWLDEGYRTIESYDRTYSEWLCVRESIKLTTVKPSGTVSLVTGSSPGAHWSPGGEYFYRTVRFGHDDPMIESFRRAGYRCEADVSNPETTTVVYFPVHSSARRSEQDVSLFEKANLAVLAQRYWSDNGVSVTLSFNPETEAEHVGTILHMHNGSLKAVSFLPMGTHNYPQAPYQQITAEVYDQQGMSLGPVNLSPFYDGMTSALDAVGETGCTTDVCEIKEFVRNR